MILSARALLSTLQRVVRTRYLDRSTPPVPVPKRRLTEACSKQAGHSGPGPPELPVGYF